MNALKEALRLLNPYDSSIKKLLTWLIICLIFPLIFLNGWLALKVFQYLQPLVTVFSLAALLALILNYPTQFLQKRGLKRSQAVSLIVLITVVLAIALGITLIPILAGDISELAQLLPQWIESSSKQLHLFEAWVASRGLPEDLSQIVTQLVNGLSGELEALADHALTLILDTVGNLSEALLTIVLTFYFLADGERIIREIFHRLPVNWGPQVERSLRLNFQNYFLGQLAIAFLVGTLMTIAFLILHIPYALLFGLTIGVMGLIPFGDLVTCAIISVLLAFQDFWLGAKVMVVALALDQVTDQLIAPRLLGTFTGLRPVWVLISLLVGTKIGGLLGLITAVPLASFIKNALDGFESLPPDVDPLALTAQVLEGESNSDTAPSDLLVKEPD
ncbi:MAG TPA: AI-2E family transporter [Crinalium sp.]